MPAGATLAWAAAVYEPGAMANWLRYMRVGSRFHPVEYLGERLRFMVSVWAE
jgi:hypothetical protein